ncbi:sialate O-acetylesterase-like [Sycon ciliatum]|uniref:sialate O-acetylesterase-like n=1 Tax=Sycon ciliatum TaxID=27933 RepID=UPI0031F70AAC
MALLSRSLLLLGFAVAAGLLERVDAQDFSFRLSNTLGSNMVLQRAPRQAAVWGWSKPQDTVTVTVDKTPGVAATADSTGMWKAMLSPMEAGGPHVVTASSKANTTVLSMENVLFGDVYICSGQSNMQFTLDQAFNATAEAAAADGFPNIRVFTVALKPSLKPELELLGITEPWMAASKASIGGGGAWKYFSAVCWLFGRDLYTSFDGKIPIGLISNNWGGTTVQSWSSAEALEKCNQTLTEGAEDVQTWPDVTEQFSEEYFLGQSDSQGVNGPLASDLSIRYNGMISPYRPMQISGAIWYQGESNVGAGARKGGEYYACQFPAMIADWRVKFNQSDMYFGFVQLAPWLDGSTNMTLIAELRQSQLAALKLPKVGVATAADHGDPTSPFGSIHPRDKQVVGARLALNALGLHYGMTTMEYQSPFPSGAEPVSVKAQGAGMFEVSIALSVTSSSVQLQWKLVNATCMEKVPPQECSTFEFQAASDKSWHMADSVSILDNKITVTGVVPGTTAVQAHPVSGVRYAYSTWPVMTLYTAADLPLLPFTMAF